jgi:hypothetical protein
MPELNCENPILDIPLSSAVPGPNDVIMITTPDGVTTIRRWSTLQQAVAPSDLDFQVGITPGYPSDGDTVYQNNAFIGRRLRVFRQFTKQTTLIVPGSYNYSFNNTTGEVIASPGFSQDEIWSIEIY